MLLNSDLIFGEGEKSSLVSQSCRSIMSSWLLTCKCTMTLISTYMFQDLLNSHMFWGRHTFPYLRMNCFQRTLSCQLFLIYLVVWATQECRLQKEWLLLLGRRDCTLCYLATLKPSLFWQWEGNAGFKAERRAEAQVTEREFGKKQSMPRELSPSLRDVWWSNKHTC